MNKPNKFLSDEFLNKAIRVLVVILLFLGALCYGLYWVRITYFDEYREPITKVPVMSTADTLTLKAKFRTQFDVKNMKFIFKDKEFALREKVVLS